MKLHCPGCGQKMDVSDIPAFSRIDCPACGGEVIVPRIFAGITLEEPVSEGPRVTVYRALDPTLDREVAVKVLTAGDPCREAFLAEARRIAAVTHANVVPIYSCGVEEEQAYVVMQFLAGGDLAHWLEQRGDEGGDPHFALRCGLALARALGTVRRQQLEHRHLIPRNVLLDVEGNIKLADFGLAASLAEGEFWQPGEFAYAAPEVLAGTDADWRADLFGVGAIVHHLLTGHLPGVGDSPEEIRRSRLAGQMPPDPARLVGELPPGLSDLIMSLQAYRPEDRPGGYEEVAGALRAFEQRLAQDSADKTRTIATRNDGAPVLKIKASAATAAAAGRPSAVPQSPAQRLVDVGLAVAALILAILLALFVWQRRSEEAPPPAPDTPPTVAPATVAVPPAIPAERRPRPPGLDFAGAAAELEAYLASLSEPVRAIEAERLAIIRGIRPQLVREMEYLVYTEGIELADGTRLDGPMPLVSEHQLVVRTSEGPVTVRWHELPFGQYARMLDYYLDRRVHQADPAVSPARLRQEIADVCLRNAVLCEWYGEPERARLAAELCREHAGEHLPRLHRLAPGILDQG